MQDDRTALVLCGTHLHNLKEIDFPDKRADQMTLEDMKTLIGRYNQGPDATPEEARDSSYATRFAQMTIRDLLSFGSQSLWECLPFYFLVPSMALHFVHGKAQRFLPASSSALRYCFMGLAFFAIDEDKACRLPVSY